MASGTGRGRGREVPAADSGPGAAGVGLDSPLQLHGVPRKEPAPCPGLGSGPVLTPGAVPQATAHLAVRREPQLCSEGWRLHCSSWTRGTGRGAGQRRERARGSAGGPARLILRGSGAGLCRVCPLSTPPPGSLTALQAPDRRPQSPAQPLRSSRGKTCWRQSTRTPGRVLQTRKWDVGVAGATGQQPLRGLSLWLQTAWSTLSLFPPCSLHLPCEHRNPRSKDPQQQLKGGTPN